MGSGKSSTPGKSPRNGTLSFDLCGSCDRAVRISPVSGTPIVRPGSRIFAFRKTTSSSFSPGSSARSTAPLPSRILSPAKNGAVRVARQIWPALIRAVFACGARQRRQVHHTIVYRGNAFQLDVVRDIANRQARGDAVAKFESAAMITSQSQFLDLFPSAIQLIARQFPPRRRFPSR